MEIPASWLHIGLGAAAGFAVGFLASLLVRRHRARKARELAEEIFLESEARRAEALDSMHARLRESFRGLSLDALAASTEQFLNLARQKLESERALTARHVDARKEEMERQVERLTKQLGEMSALVRELEKDRSQKFGELSGQLRKAWEQTEGLIQTTNTLREALSSSRARGQWGERMAEDVLRLAGFVEEVNYRKQRRLEGASGRPDFTFLLPRGLKLHMDVKFPLDNYLRALEAQTDAERDTLVKAFLRDVKARVKEVTGRAYIDPEGDTVDCVLLFIPNEQVYAFIHEQDRAALEDALRMNVILCSPSTLFAVLAVVRQAVDNFTLEKTSTEILSLLAAFRKNWTEYLRRFETLGKRLSEAQKEYDALATTRRRMLERPLDRIEDLRSRRGVRAAEIPEVVDEEGFPTGA